MQRTSLRPSRNRSAGCAIPDNLDAAVKKYGALAAVTKPEDIAEYKKWLGAKKMFMTRWDGKAIDAQWSFLDVCQRTGIIPKVPAKDKYALFVES